MKYLMLVALLFLGCEFKENPVCDGATSKIKSVGGCDKDGDCGVILEDDTVLMWARQPVVGAKPHGIHCRKAP